jgi:hypothetical protein
MGISSKEFRAAGFSEGSNRTSTRTPATKHRAERGTGLWSINKRKRAERTPVVLELLNINQLPNDVRVKPEGGAMNGLEIEYAETLRILQRVGEVVQFDFEPIDLHIGVGTCWFSPDFIVRLKDGTILADDTKGERKASGIRGIKVAAKQFPGLKFRIVTKTKAGWVYEEIRENK